MHMRISTDLLRSLIQEAILNAFEVLGVPRDATPEQIKSAWKKLAILNHPDKGGEHGKMIDINRAYDLLKDPNRPPWKYEFQGYEPSGGSAPKDAPKPPPAAAQPDLRTCPWCSRNVNAKVPPGGWGKKFVNHYSTPGGPTKCPGSGKGIYERPESAAPKQPPPPPSGGSSYSGSSYSSSSQYDMPKRYYTYIKGTSRKFWEISVKGVTVTVRYGRIGSAGHTKTKAYSAPWQAMKMARRLINNKLDKGYVQSSPGAAPPKPGPTTAGPAKPKPPPTGVPKKDVYKVYPWRQGRRVVRVGGKLFGTDPGGRLKAGGITKFNANDRVKVGPDGKRMKVSAMDSDHSQDWDPIDEVRSLIDEAVMDVIIEIAER